MSFDRQECYPIGVSTLLTRSVINVFSRRATGFHGGAKLFELNFVIREISHFTITEEVLARSLANFYCQYADRHMNLKFVQCVSERERAIRSFVIEKTNCPVINNEFRHHIVKVVCGSTRLSPRGSTATLTM